MLSQLHEQHLEELYNRIEESNRLPQSRVCSSH